MAKNMTQNEFLEFLKGELYISSCSDRKREEIISYLLGERETTETVPQFQKSYFPYGLLRTIEDQFRSDLGDMAKRAYRLLGRMCADKLIYNKEYEGHTFRTYKAAGMDEAFVIKAISHRIHQYFMSPAYGFSRVLQEMEGNRKELNSLAEAYGCYENLIDSGIRLGEAERKSESPDSVVLKAFGMVWFDKDKEKEKEYRRLAEQAVFALLKGAYGEDGALTAAAQGLFSEEAMSLYQKVDALDLGTGNTERDNILLGLCYVLYKRSELLRDALKLCIVMMGPQKYCNILRLSFRPVYETLTQIQVPVAERVKLAASSGFTSCCPAMEQFTKIGAQAAEWLTECYRENRDVFVAVYQELHAGRGAEAFPLLAVLMREEQFMDESKADHAVMSYLEGMSGKLSLYYNGKILRDYGMLRKEPLDFKEFDLRNNGRQSYEGVIAVCAVMFDYSVSARNFFTMMIDREYRQQRYSLWHYQHYFTAMEGYGKREPVSGKNKQEATAWYFERLAGTAGVLLVLATYAEGGQGSQFKGFTLFARAHQAEAQAVFDEARKAQSDRILNFVAAFYTEDLGLSKESLVLVLENRMKSVVNFMEEFLKNREGEARPYVEALEKSKNKNTREAVDRLLKLWDDDKIARKLQEITDIGKLTEMVKGMYKTSNRSKIPYIDQLDLSGVKLYGSGEKAEAVLLEFYLSEYMLLKEVYKIRTCEKIRKFLEPSSLQRLVKDIYIQWLRDGADTKIKNLLIPYAISASTGDITEFKKQIDLWTENSRGALAAFAVSALALNDSDIALLITDGIAKKYKNKQVRAAAEESMEKAASVLGITKEALGDRIVPNLSFNRNRERIFDYGTRKFRAVLTEKLEILVYDESGKLLKNLPKPGAKDDQAVAEAEAAAFKDLKKQLKTVVSSQKARLEDAVITGRRWTRPQWEKLFVDNPVMNGFAIGLVWEEVDAAGKLLGTFRYMEDGSFNSPEEEEYELGENSEILLLHPLDVSGELLETWNSQLEDYEIKQPISQLAMPVYQLKQEEKEETRLSRHEGTEVYFGTIRGIMDKYDWKKTSICDGGGYEGYYYEDAASGIGVQMTFDFIYVGMAPDETVKMGYLEFYKKGSVEYGSYTYDEITDEKRVLPKEVPAKLLSFALMVGDLISQKAV